VRAFRDDHTEDLMFEGYDDNQPVNEIEISGRDGDELAVWYDDDLRLRLAASDLRDALEAQTDAAQAVIDAWAKGDLVGASARWTVAFLRRRLPSPRRGRGRHDPAPLAGLRPCAGAGDRGQRQPRRGRPARLTVLPAAPRRFGMAAARAARVANAAQGRIVPLVASRPIDPHMLIL
jgi:hypothetical protein